MVMKESLRQQKNKTGIPTNLKQQMEQFSGLSLDSVRVHYSSGNPAQLKAYADTQGNDVYVAPGQEKHLQHERSCDSAKAAADSIHS